MTWRVAVLVLLLAAPVAEAQVAGEKRAALVVGNAAYKTAPLRNPINDARAMAATLGELGFRTSKLENASRAQMQKAMLEFGRSLDRDTVGLFYFSGHGMQVRGSNYLIPVGAEIAGEDEVEVEALDANYLLSRLATANNRLNIVILDSCRDNPYARSFRGVGRGLAAITAPTGTVIAYATAPGSVAADGSGDRGLYTGALIDALREPGLRIEDAFKRTRAAVIARSNGGQTPWESSSLLGDFYFRAPAAPVQLAAVGPVALPTPAGAKPAAEKPLVAALAPQPANISPTRIAGPVAHRCPQPGTEILTSLGGRLSFTGSDGMSCHYRGAKGKEYSRWAGFFQEGGQYVAQRRVELARLWPLEVGKSIAVKSVETDGKTEHTYTVQRQENVTVSGSTLETFVVQHQERSHGGGFLAYARYWYAPAVGYFVKFENQLERGRYKGTAPQDWHATGVILPKS